MATFRQFFELTQSLSLTHALLSVAAVALLTHVYFNRFEPFAIPVLGIFLFFIPFTLSVLLRPHYALPWNIGFAFLTYHATLLGSIALYRLSPFHPLSKYPGPLRLKLSSVGVYQIASQGKRHEYIRGLHEKYKSDVVRIGPNELSFCAMSAMVPILGPDGLSKGPGWDGQVKYAPERALISWRDPVMHAKRRQPFNRGLNVTAIKEYEPVLAKRVGQMVELAIHRNRQGEMVNMTDLCRAFAFDFMGDMAFGGGSEIMRDGDPRGILKALRAGVDDAIASEIFPWLAYYTPNNMGALVASAAERAMDRITRGPLVNDLFHYLNNEDGAEEGSPPPQVVIPEGVLISIAGSDTVSAMICAAVYLLIQHPEVYKKLQEEIDHSYPPGENALDCGFHPEMHFLDAVINEVLRLYPVLASGSHRATDSKGKVIGSWYVPPHTSVRFHVWTVHRDPRNFSPNPDAFWPERWLIAKNPSAFELSSKAAFIHNLNAFIPFSIGPANCAGKLLAIKEMKMTLCHLLQQADLAFVESYDASQWDRDFKDCCLGVDVGKLPVVVSPRHATK